MNRVIRWWEFRRRYHCPHERLDGIYGDAIQYFGWRRNLCADCGKTLDGPVSISQSRPYQLSANALIVAPQDE